MLNNGFFYEQKKGDPAALKGVVIVFANITQPEAGENKKSPLYEMAKTGILAATGDYRTQNSLQDFLKNELGMTLEDLGKSENLSIAGLPENVNPEFIRKKLESLKDFEDLIPTPAKIEVFDSEDEILSRDADIFYLGTFERLANANLAINAFPILYQAIFREQVALRIAAEIEKMLSGATREANETGHYLDDLDNLEKKLLTGYIPELIYNRLNPEERDKWVRQLKNFMAGYKYPSEIETIISLSTATNGHAKKSRDLIELYVKKISAFLKEDYKLVGNLKKEIEQSETGK